MEQRRPGAFPPSWSPEMSSLHAARLGEQPALPGCGSQSFCTPSLPLSNQTRGLQLSSTEYPGDRACCLSRAQTSSGRERPDFPLSRQVTIGGFIDPRKQSLCFIRGVLVMNAASGSGEAVVNPSLNVVSTGLRAQMLGSSSNSAASFPQRPSHARLLGHQSSLEIG